MKKSSTSKKYGTDYERLAAMTDEDIDFSDLPEATPEMLARGVLCPPLNVREPKGELKLRVDRDVLEWIQSQRPGYETVINLVLRAHMQERLRKSRKPKARRVS
jgi:uncharacterized protein (DUF4415 family)